MSTRWKSSKSHCHTVSHGGSTQGDLIKILCLLMTMHVTYMNEEKVKMVRQFRGKKMEEGWG